VSHGDDLEDLLVRTLRDPARALPAPADPMAGIRSRAHAQRRNLVLAVAAAVAVVVVAVLTPFTLRTSADLPPATGQSLLDWGPRGALVNDTALVADAERAWREAGGARRPAGPVSLLYAGDIGEQRVVLLQGRDAAGAPLLAETAATGAVGPQRLVRADPLTDTGIVAIRVSTEKETSLVVRPDTATLVVLGSSTTSEFLGPGDGVVVAASGLTGRQLAALDLGGRVLGDGVVADDGRLPLVRRPLRVASPTWQRHGLTPRGGDLTDALTLAALIARTRTAGPWDGPIEIAAVAGGSSIEIGGRMAEPRLYELRRSGRTWLASGVSVPGAAVLQCPRATEITGRVADVHAYLSRCRLPALRGGLLHLVLDDDVRATRVTIAAAAPGQLAVDSAGQPVDGGLVQAFDTNFPTGPGRVTLADAAGTALPPLEVPAYS
jgi:hypothetical protein